MRRAPGASGTTPELERAPSRGLGVRSATAVRIDFEVAQIPRVDVASPERDRAVLVPARVRLRRQGKTVGRGRARSKEQDDLPSVGDNESRQEKAVERPDRERRIGSNGLGDALEHLLEASTRAGPDPFDECDKGIAYSVRQPSLDGHRTSETVATMAPAMAAATPFRRASLVMMRAKKDGVDMEQNLLEVESSMALIPGELGKLRAPFEVRRDRAARRRSVLARRPFENCCREIIPQTQNCAP